MQSILHELYYGNINPNEKPFTRSSEHDKTLRTLCDNEKKLLDCLNAEEKILFEDFSKAQGDLSCLSIADGFVDGFCLGVRIAIEVMEKQF